MPDQLATDLSSFWLIYSLSFCINWDKHAHTCTCTHTHTHAHTHTHTNLYLLYLYAYLLLPELAVCMALIQGASQQEATRPWCSCWQREHQPYLPSCLALTVARPMRRGRWGTALSDSIRVSIQASWRWSVCMHAQWRHALTRTRLCIIHKLMYVYLNHN